MRCRVYGGNRGSVRNVSDVQELLPLREIPWERVWGLNFEVLRFSMV